MKQNLSKMSIRVADIRKLYCNIYIYWYKRIYGVCGASELSLKKWSFHAVAANHQFIAQPGNVDHNCSEQKGDQKKGNSKYF